jgi:pimeloyl-ACP methyl ester carboxylesterase
MTGCARWRPRAAVAAAAAITAAVLASVAYQEAAAARDRRRFPPPGRLVDVSGRKLHMLEAGHGTPTVVIVPALGDNVLVWMRIQRALASEMRVCVYDRAGIGWSDPSPRGRRTIDGAAGDLRALLDAAGIEPPLILVGHSIGGAIARRFATRYPDMVAGMVLVDSSHERQSERHGVNGFPYGRPANLRRAVRVQLRILGARRLAAALGLLRALDADIDREVLAEHAGAHRAIMLSTRQRRAVVREIVMMARIAETPPPLGSIPLTVITAGGRIIPGWREMQDELAALSARSIHITAQQSGHYVHLDEPELVVQAIRNLVRRVARG